MQTFASIMCAKFCVMLSLFFISLCFLYIVNEEVLYMGTKKTKKVASATFYACCP